MAHQGNRHLTQAVGQRAAEPGAVIAQVVTCVQYHLGKVPLKPGQVEPRQAAAAALQAPAVRCQSGTIAHGKHLEPGIQRNADLAREGLVARCYIANGRDVGRVERGDEPANARPSAGAAVGCM